jgi:hypothetical protein
VQVAVGKIWRAAARSREVVARFGGSGRTGEAVEGSGGGSKVWKLSRVLEVEV